MFVFDVISDFIRNKGRAVSMHFLKLELNFIQFRLVNPKYCVTNDFKHLLYTLLTY